MIHKMLCGSFFIKNDPQNALWIISELQNLSDILKEKRKNGSSVIGVLVFDKNTVIPSLGKFYLPGHPSQSGHGKHENKDLVSLPVHDFPPRVA
ncbi:MAG: hypothetical protein AB1611_17315 [bacterium]